MRSGIITILIALFAATTLSLTGCGGSGGGSNNTTMATTNKVVSTVTVVDGNNQNATVGTELTNALIALIKNSEGQPIAGQTVNFKVTSGGGTVFAGAATSDASGYARERWTLGTAAGAQRVEVRAVDSNGTAVVFATFDATGTASTAQTCSAVSGGGQSYEQLKTLPAPITVIVKDAYGNPKSGVTVTFTPDSGGTVLPASATTNSNGEAETVWTLGQTIGTQKLNAYTTGLTPLIFWATATQALPSVPTGLSKVSGDLQTPIQHLLIPTPLEVLLVDILGNPVPNQTVTFSFPGDNVYGNPVIVTTDSIGKATWSGYLHTSGDQQVTVSAIGCSPVVFKIAVTASLYKYDGLYLIGAPGWGGGRGGDVGIYFVNGSSSYRERYALHGAINDVDGTFSANTEYGTDGNIYFTGKVVVDGLKQATVTGTYFITGIFNYIGPTTNWTGYRQ